MTPTAERIAKGDLSHNNARDRTQRVYRQHGLIAKMHDKKLCDLHHVQAFHKYEQHYHGAQGHDVRVSDVGSGDFPDVESARTYHAQRIAKANFQISRHGQYALEKIITDSKASLETIGAALSPYQDRRQTTAYGAAVVVEALENLAKWWGMR